MSNVILNPQGFSATQTEKQYDPRLVAMLAMLASLLKEQGLSLYCMKCHALGLPDGVEGLSAPGQYILQCGCTRRTLDTRGKATIQ